MKIFQRSFAVACAIFILCSTASAQNLSLIPAPASFVPQKGKFAISAKTSLKYPASFAKEAAAFQQMLSAVYGFTLSENPAEENVIVIDNGQSGQLITPEASHTIKIEDKKISIGSPGNDGSFYALMSLLQLMNNKKNEIQCGTITDQAAYKWRGMHLDVSRHFFPKDFIKKYIDLIALHKMNTFHWHLTDDQGWRIEIKKYPLLTKKGAWRKGNMIGHALKQRYDTLSYGGYYTQAEIKEIVEYAAARNVTVVPEIEMPGHSQAALAAYPQFACKDTTFSVGKRWGVYEDVFCSKDETFKFIEDVLSEVTELFPSTYIHIGGDECPKTRWKQCAKCQERIKNEGLKNEEELQSYFIKRVEKFINSKGKKLIGWDEILEGGLAPNAAVMSWRGTEGGEKAAKENHNVVMTPGSYCYFDHYQAMPEYEPVAIGGFTTLQKVYSYDPTPEFLSDGQKKFILGAQGNVWTEYINTAKDVEYMALPRMSALAEALWTKPGNKNWDNFSLRMADHFSFLDKMKVNYSRSLYDVHYKTRQNKSADGYEVVLSSQCKGIIRYTTDGKEPDNKSQEYTSPFAFDKSTTVKAALFIDGKMAGRVMKKDFMVSLASGRNVKYNNPLAEGFDKQGTFGLVNGVLESASLQRNMCTGWRNRDANFIVDLGGQKEVKKVTLYFLQDTKNAVIQPKSVTVYFTTDGSRYQIAGKAKYAYSGEDYMKMEITFEPFTTNLLKIRAENTGKVTAGTASHNGDLWLLLDEVVIE